MDTITQSDINELIGYSGAPCVSIFMPTNRSGKEVLEQQDRTHLKATWNACKRKLEDKGVGAGQIQKMESPIEDLINDSDFWRQQSDGLALFIATGFFKKYTLPVAFEEYTYISNEFYLKPLAPILSGNGKFFLLSLQLKEVHFYKATKNSMEELKIDEITPSTLKERVGYDYEEKNLQFRSQQEGEGHAIFHGHGAGGKDHKEEIFKFYKAIDAGLSKLLEKETAPLVVFCQDYMFPIYKEANTYKNLYDTPVRGNPNDVGLTGLHHRAINTVKPYLEEEERKKAARYKDASLTEKSATVHDIIPAAFEGKIDTLFIETNAEIWGTYNEATMEVQTQREQTPENTSLINLAVIKVLENKGAVYLVEPGSMPEKEAKMHALLRYR